MKVNNRNLDKRKSFKFKFKTLYSFRINIIQNQCSYNKKTVTKLFIKLNINNGFDYKQKACVVRQSVATDMVTISNLVRFIVFCVHWLRSLLFFFHSFRNHKSLLLTIRSVMNE